MHVWEQSQVQEELSGADAMEGDVMDVVVVDVEGVVEMGFQGRGALLYTYIPLH